MVVTPLEILCTEFCDDLGAWYESCQCGIDAAVFYTNIVNSEAPVPLALDNFPLLTISSGGDKARVRGLASAFREDNGIMEGHQKDRVGRESGSDNGLFPLLGCVRG